MNKQSIIIKGLRQNNLKNISLEIPKNKIIVFTGVSGSGKSSIVFDTIAAESQRQMNETYPAFIRSRLPKHEMPKADFVANLSPSVIVDQSRLGGNARSTVGTITDLYSMFRVLYSRIGMPYAGTASFFSFNDPNGMCQECSGLGKVTDIDIESVLNYDKSMNEGICEYTAFKPGSWYWKKYAGSGLFNLDKKLRDYTEKERNILLYGAYEKGGEQLADGIEGFYNYLARLLLKRDRSSASETTKERVEKMIIQIECMKCHGSRLNDRALECRINGYNIAELCDMEFSLLLDVLKSIEDNRGKTIIASITAAVERMVDIGLPYLNLNRPSQTLSGGEAQRVKLVRYMGSSLTDMMYIFDEPSTGMHPRDVHRMTKLLKQLRDKGNTVIVVEHDKDVISVADEVIDIGPCAGRNGGQVLFQGSYKCLLESDTLTGRAMKEIIPVKKDVRKPLGYLSVKGAKLHNLKNVSVDIPLGVITVVTGVAGSGKSTLIRDVFAKKYEDMVVVVDQSPIAARRRSTAVTYLGFFDEIRNIMAKQNKVTNGLFSFNSEGACPACSGKGMIVTELVFMDPVVTVCEKCEGRRYSEESLYYKYKEKNIVEILDMTAEEAFLFFDDNTKISRKINSMLEVGLSYLTLGQPLPTLSGGELQRLKLAENINKKGNIFVLDEPTTGLHASDIKKVLKLFDLLVSKGNTVIVIEHNVEVMKQADYIIDIGPDGGNAGGEVLYTGTPADMIKNSDTITSRYLRV